MKGKTANLSNLIGIIVLGIGTANAQISDPQLTISLLSEDANYDGNSAAVSFTGLQLTQGLLKIEADQGRASELNFEEAVWELSGNVTIDIEGGRITCDTASLQFTANELRIADISGLPATFELQREGASDRTYAEANKLRYELASNAIEFSGNAKIIEGGNQITSSFIVYSIAEQRIQASSSAEDGKVKMTFTPRSDPDADEPKPEPNGDAP
jgi:lipopolysaccharide transport protein LptA